MTGAEAVEKVSVVGCSGMRLCVVAQNGPKLFLTMYFTCQKKKTHFVDFK